MAEDNNKKTPSTEKRGYVEDFSFLAKPGETTTGNSDVQPESEHHTYVEDMSFLATPGTAKKAEKPIKEEPKVEPIKEMPKVEPIKTEPVKEEPKVEPIKEMPKVEPIKVESIKEEPKAEPVKEMPKVEPIKAEPVKEMPKVEPIKAEPVKEEPKVEPIKEMPKVEPIRVESIKEEPKVEPVETQTEMDIEEKPVKETPSKEEVKAEKAALKAAEKAAKAENKAVKPAKTKGTKKKGKKMMTYQQRQNKLGYAFMTPWIIGFVLFTLFPFIATIYLSFTEVKSTVVGYKIKLVGLNNYVAAFIKSTDFTKDLIAYLRMIIPYTFIVVVISFIIAYLLNKIKTGKGLLRTIYFLPVIIMSGPVMSQLLDVQNASSTAADKIAAATTDTNAYSNIFIMQMIQSYSKGLANGLADVFDQLSIILWFTGIPIVLFINGLQKINVSIYEAAKIDSANSWQIMWKITVPMLKQIGMIITIFTVIQLGMYESINPVYKLIQDATGDTTGGLGFAATYAWIYSAIVLVIIGVVMLLFRDRKPKDIKARQKQEKKLKKLDKQQQKNLKRQNRYAAKEAKKYGK